MPAPAQPAVPAPAQPPVAAAAQPPVPAPAQPAAGAQPRPADAPQHHAHTLHGDTNGQPADTNGKPANDAAKRPSFTPGRKLVAAVVALLCLAGGVVGSILGAQTVAHNDTTSATHASEQSAAAIASTARLALEREQQLGVSGATFFAGDSRATHAEFNRWAKWAQTLRRNPELKQLGLVALVHAPELPTFGLPAVKRTTPASTTSTSASATAEQTLAAQADAATAGLTPTPQSAPHVTVRPTGARPYYCLALAGLARNRGESPPADLDYCAKRSGLLLSRDTGFSHYTLLSSSGNGALEVLMPVYKGNQPPVGVEARKGAFAGWLREVFAPGVIVSEALQGHSGAGVQMAFHGGTASAAFAGGSVRPGVPSTSVDVHDGWTVQGFGAPVSTGVANDGGALALLIVGCVLSALLALLVL
ncbi:MAG TPA: hypothetical protein VK765_01245, partial [Solirubrobacteraceae bacterium]|nr:hypothetical protein [Solirubrobacteraceae bacterium]